MKRNTLTPHNKPQLVTQRVKVGETKGPVVKGRVVGGVEVGSVPLEKKSLGSSTHNQHQHTQQQKSRFQRQNEANTHSYLQPQSVPPRQLVPALQQKLNVSTSVPNAHHGKHRPEHPPIQPKVQPPPQQIRPSSQRNVSSTWHNAHHRRLQPSQYNHQQHPPPRFESSSLQKVSTRKNSHCHHQPPLQAQHPAQQLHPALQQKVPKKNKSSATKEWMELEKIFTENPEEGEFRSLGLCFGGFGLDRQDVRERSNDERFSAFYGVSAKTLLAVFVDVKDANPSIKTKDFFMTVSELKLYLTEHVQAGIWGIDENTFRRRWKEVMKAIASMSSEKIKFDPDDFPAEQIFILSVDGVNFTIHEPRAKDPGSHWYDHKSHSAGLSYEVAVDIRRSRILWIKGPRPASVSESVTFNGGKKKDKIKDLNCLSAKIPEGKRAIADSGLRGSAKVSTTKAGHSKEAKKFMSRVRSRMETLFLRFKNFGILRQRFRHDIELHRDILLAVAVLVAYDMENGHPLFDV